MRRNRVLISINSPKLQIGDIAPMSMAERRFEMVKDIVVHLDGSAEDETRLSYAELLAGAQGAHVTGLYTNVMPDIA
ncbi:hypothetical protein, partial [Enterobacter hormaechei]|uniref:hypothetical protein n=1 Tax=Enterobacter hormaechei TaxID=158836 RepID=UPI0019531963